MADIRISQLPVAPAPIDGTELVPVVQNGLTVQTTVSAITQSPSLTATFLTVNQEPLLPNSRALSAGVGIGITDGGAQSTYNLSLNGTSGSLEVASTGVIVKTAPNTISARTLTASGNGISVADGDGVSGNPTFQLTGLAAAIANMSGTGLVGLNSTTLTPLTLIGVANEISVADGNGAGGNPTIGIADNAVFPGVAGVTLPNGTTAERGATLGQIRYNTTSSRFEGNYGTGWQNFGTGDGAIASVAGTTNQIVVSTVGAAATVSIDPDPVIPGVGAIQIPAGTTVERPGGVNGQLRYNSTTATFEGYANGSWGSIAAGAGVTSVGTGTGLTGGPITSTGTISIANTAVAAGSYGSATAVPTYTVNAQGQLTAAANVSIAIPSSAITDKGLPNGVATLDSGGKVPVSELPAAVLGALSYQGTWNASTNTPTLASGVGTKGYYYVVSVAGTTNLDGITDWQIGDWAVYNGTAWQKVDNSDVGGDVVGPASATDNAVARYDGTTGKIIQNSAVTIADDGATVIAANSPTDGLRITQTGSGNALLVEDAANPDATPFVIDAVGSVITGYTQSQTIAGAVYQYQMNGSNPFSAIRWNSSNSLGLTALLGRSRSGTVGVNSIVSANDVLGTLTWAGDDGTAFVQAASISAAVDGTPGTNDMPGRLVFSTTADGASSPTEAMRIRSDRNIGIGSSGNATSKVSIGGTYATSGGFSSGFETAAVIPSGTTTLHANFDSKVYTQAASFTLGTLHHFAATQPSAFGAGSTVTTQVGFNAQSNLTGATNNYGFYSNIASGTGRWNFYANGTAANYFGGIVQVSAPAGNTSPLLELSGNNNASGATNTLRFTDGDGSSATNQQLGKIEFSTADASATAGVKAYVGSFSESDAPAAYLSFGTAGSGDTPTERMRIRSDGNIGIAASGAAGTRITIGGTAAESGGFAAGVALTNTIPSTATTLYSGYYSAPSTQAAAFTLSNLRHFIAEQPVAFGAGSTVTNQFGFAVNSNLTGATNNFGFYSNIASGTGRWNFYAAGTAANYFAGNVGIGTASVVNGYSFGPSLTIGNAGSVAFNNASNIWNSSTAGGAITYFTDNNLYIDAKDSTSTIKFRVNGANIRGEIASNGTWSLGAAPGAESLRVTPVASAVNYVDVQGSAASGVPLLTATGSDANISLRFNAKALGTVIFGNAVGTSFRVRNDLTSANFIDAFGHSTGNAPFLRSEGTDTNIGISLISKGTGTINFLTNGGVQLRIAHTASAVNYLQVTGGATGNAATLSAQGSDTNIDLTLTPKGTGVARINATTALVLPAGTTAQRPTAATGQVRFNSSTTQFEGYNGTVWGALGGGNTTTEGLWENANTISANYTIGTNNNALSAGPITIASGVTVTVPSGSVWSIV